MEYLIFSFPRSGNKAKRDNDSATLHAMPPEEEELLRTECLKTWFLGFLGTLLYAG